MSIVVDEIRQSAAATGLPKRSLKAFLHGGRLANGKLSGGRDVPPRSLMPSLTARVITRIALTIVALYFLLPIIWMLISTTKTDTELATTFGFWFAPTNSIMANWRSLDAWTQGNFLRWIGNSIFYSTTSAVIGTLISVMAGYAIAKFVFPGKRVTLGVIMSAMLLPGALLTVPLHALFHQVGLVNTIWAIIIPSIVSPFGVFLGTVYAQTSVPTELLEAARIDGAGELRIFFTMVLRILGPAMVTIFLFIFVGTWNNFMLPLMMISSTELRPVTLGLFGMMTHHNPHRPAVILGSLLGVLPLVVIFFGLQRYWRAGLAAGAVKG